MSHVTRACMYSLLSCSRHDLEKVLASVVNLGWFILPKFTVIHASRFTLKSGADEVAPPNTTPLKLAKAAKDCTPRAD